MKKIFFSKIIPTLNAINNIEFTNITVEQVFETFLGHFSQKTIPNMIDSKKHFFLEKNMFRIFSNRCNNVINYKIHSRIKFRQIFIFQIRLTVL